jgi:hypothetical protein
MSDGGTHDVPEGAEEDVDLSQDPIVDRLKPDPTQPAAPTLTLMGFFGDSDRPGFRRLYFTQDLDYYAEFRVEDVLQTARIPEEQPPFLGEQATRVSLRRDAAIDYTWTRNARPLDEFDLDVRFGRRPAFAEEPLMPLPATPGDVGCDVVTPGTCMDTCQTCPTNCGTCETCPDWPGCERRVRPRR